MCLPVLIHKLADKQEDKLQDGIPVSASYVKNGISKPQEGILHEAPFLKERVDCKAANFVRCLCEPKKDSQVGMSQGS